MTLCKYGYGNMPYGDDYYGLGQYNGIQGRDIALYFPNRLGNIDLNNPITYVPIGKPGVNIPSLTSAGEAFLTDLRINPNVFYRSYHKIFVYNHNPLYAFSGVTVEVDPSTDPEDFIFLAPNNSYPLPVDGDYSNVNGGLGPDPQSFVQHGPISVSSGIQPGGSAAFWVRRDIVVKFANQRYLNHTFIIKGRTLADGVSCP